MKSNKKTKLSLTELIERRDKLTPTSDEMKPIKKVMSEIKIKRKTSSKKKAN